MFIYIYNINTLMKQKYTYETQIKNSSYMQTVCLDHKININIF